MRFLLIILIAILTSALNAPFAKRHHRVHSAHKVVHHHIMHHLPVPMDGIDISRHQKEIKWGQLMNGEHRPKFVYARCMGLDLRHDVRYDSYVDSAQQYDVPLGTYLFYTNYNKHFLELEEDTLSTDSMQGKVRAVSGSALIHYLEFKERVDKKKQKLLPVIDVEEQSVFDFAEDRHMERPYDKYLKFNVFILACLLRAEYGERPIIYSNQNFYSRFLAPTFDDYPLWIARYRTLHVPSPKSDLPFPYAVKPIMWQFTDRGLLRGIPHYVDMDHFVNDATLETIKIKDKRYKKVSPSS